MSPAALFVFLLVSALQMLDRVLDLARKRGSFSDDQLKLRMEITQLLKEASALSTPSTFAQAAKLKRLAAAKEKDMAKLQELNIKGKQSLYDQYGRVLLITKVLIYGVLIMWFWSTPVTTVPQHLLQPFVMAFIGLVLFYPKDKYAFSRRIICFKKLFPLFCKLLHAFDKLLK
ncbi:protein GET1-like isoform X2 [Phragmites australis]|uniref:protein GET1-like isoform X2 n=1 Tax=Phragmites australis TaxID=29695 RepID=UPI002D78E5B3|nr:protein GET1-like isoform X2 [Phragmites australis]